MLSVSDQESRDPQEAAGESGVFFYSLTLLHGPSQHTLNKLLEKDWRRLS